MKARVKETGEILEVIDLYDDGTAYATNGSYYKVSTLDFDALGAIDWEQRRYEIAKDCLAGYTSNSSDRIMNANVLDQIETSIKIADVLIEKLKKDNEQRDNRASYDD